LKDKQNALLATRISTRRFPTIEAHCSALSPPRIKPKKNILDERSNLSGTTALTTQSAADFQTKNIKTDISDSEKK
jgi:hypothetical protein